MNILLTGASGFFGGHLRPLLEGAGHRVLTVGRGAGADHDWSQDSLRAGVEHADAVVHLAGESLVARRWSARQKERILASRVELTSRLAELLAERGRGVLVSASAVGFYGSWTGPRGDEELGEDAPSGDDFPARVCRAWEEAARTPLAGSDVRLAIVRIGVILGADGGALKRMLLPFRLGLGGPLGGGRQILPWIHVGDLARLFQFILETPSAAGAFNGTAPGAVDSAEFARTLGRVLGRPAFLPVPGPALRLALGEVAGMLLKGQRAVPRRALVEGFAFEHPLLEPALRDLLGRPASSDPKPQAEPESGRQATP